MEDIFQVVLHIAASIALIALAWLFVSLVRTVKTAQSVLENTNTIAQSLVGEVQGIRASLQGTLQNVEVITARIPATLDNVNAQLHQVDGILGSVRHLTDGVAVDVARMTTDATDIIHAAKGVVISLIDLEQDIQVKVQRPIVELMSVFSALGKGIHAFRMKVAGNRDEYHPLSERDDFDDEDELDDEYEEDVEEVEEDVDGVVDFTLDYDDDLDEDFDFDAGSPPTDEAARSPAFRA